jgi:hypothetical protein
MNRKFAITLALACLLVAAPLPAWGAAPPAVESGAAAR